MSSHFQPALEVGVVCFPREAFGSADAGPQTASGCFDEGGGAPRAKAVLQPPGHPGDGAQHLGLVRREAAARALDGDCPHQASRQNRHSRSSTASRMAEQPAVPPMSGECIPA